MDILTTLELVDLVKSNDSETFKSNIQNLPFDIINFTDLLDDESKEKAIVWSREKGVYLVHKIFQRVTKIDSIKFLKDNLEFYLKNHLRDENEKTWLHIAVKNNRKKEILSYLVEEMKIDVEKSDINKYTALHIACQKNEYISGEISILVKRSDQLIAKSFDDITPLELACNDKNKLKEIKSNKNIHVNKLLSKIDKISKGLLVTDEYQFNEKLSIDKTWMSLFQKNDKYRLINYIKKDSNFNDKYFLNSNDIKYIITKSYENGQGILTYIKNKYYNNNTDTTPEHLFTELTGLKIHDENSKEIMNENENPREFYKSSLFVAVVTGRFELASSLLTCCQFEVISYGLLVCLICHNLISISEFSDQVIESIKKLKNFCEIYSMEVMNRVGFRDFTPNKRIISGFINKPNYLAGQRILDIAYLGKCSKFLSLPSCQGALNKLWKKRTWKCPVAKFFTHSLIHCVFLLLFSYFLVHDFYFNISSIEIICYIYGFGYFIEEFRQIYIYRKKDFLKSYFQDASNYVDIGSLGFMLLGFILRFCLRSTKTYTLDDEGLFLESKDVNLFVSRLVLCISLILFFMRIIYFGSVFQQLGPKLKMISTMIVRDLIPLIFIFIVFITSFGVTFQALLYPNSFYARNDTLSFEKRPIFVIISDIFKRSTYTIFHTHFALEEMEHHETPYYVNYEGNIAVYVLLVVYMIVVNIMLINLLIALFSDTVTTIIQVSSESWKLHRYKDIKEYCDRSMLPPPMNIFEIIIECICSCARKNKVLKVNEEEGQNLLQDDEFENKKGLSMSFKILQAFALRDCRHTLGCTPEDKEYERKIEIKAMKEAIIKIKSTLNEPSIKGQWIN